MNTIEKPTHKTKIFRADLRSGSIETNKFHEKYTLPSKHANADVTAACGSLQVMKEVSLNAGYRQFYKPKEHRLLYLLPIVGRLYFSGETEMELNVGESALLYIHKDTVYSLMNPHKEEVNNFLYFEFEASESELYNLTQFSIPHLRNTLESILNINASPTEHHHISMGIFDGRTKYRHELKVKQSLFVYVIDGVFEAQECLLEKADSLYIQDTDYLEFESLSDEAVILVLRV